MPQVFKAGPYTVFFWSDESEPLEPVHVHVAAGKPSGSSTKIWITQEGRALLCHNHSHIPARELSRLMRMIEANSEMILSQWKDYFEEIRFYC